MSDNKLNLNETGELINPSEGGIDVKNFDAYSSTTPHYDLPLLEGQNVYSPLTTWNGSMDKIDNALFDIATSGQATDAAVAALKNESERQDRELDEIRAVDKVQTENIANLMGSVAELKSDQSTILKDLVEQNALVKALTNDVNELQKNDEFQDSRLDELSEDVDEILDKVGREGEEGTLEALIDANTDLINVNKSDIDNHWKGVNPKVTNPSPNDQLTDSINKYNSWIENQPKSRHYQAVAGTSFNINTTDLRNEIGDSLDLVFLFLYSPSATDVSGVIEMFSLSGSGSYTKTTTVAGESVSIRKHPVGQNMIITITPGARTLHAIAVGGYINMTIPTVADSI